MCIRDSGKTYSIKTGSDGVAILSDIPVYDSNNQKIVYTISEKNVPVQYVIPAEQTDVYKRQTLCNSSFEPLVIKYDSKSYGFVQTDIRS